MKKVSYDDWESGKVKLTDEIFKPILGWTTGYTYENDKVIEHRKVLGYRGEITGTQVGLWLGEVMER